MENSYKVIVKNYIGNEDFATAAFKNDVLLMAKNDYYPTSQNYTPGQYGCGSFIIAFILCFLLVGILMFIYMLIVKPDGVLTVTYEYRPEKLLSRNYEDEKDCPMCAEKVKLQAKICRYCGHTFE